VAISVDVESRLERTPALDDWHTRMISRVRHCLSAGIWDDGVEQAEKDQTLGAELEIDDRARALSNAPEGKGTITMPEELDSLGSLFIGSKLCTVNVLNILIELGCSGSELV
jgi:hypothetical protein